MNKDNRLGNGAIIVLLIGSLFAARLIMLFQSPWPNGLDGAYYAMEFRSFMERGHLENPDLSPVFRIGGLISLLTGDPVASVKICSALLSAVLTGGMYLLLRIIKPEKPDAAWLAATLTSLSPSLSKMSVNYLNNMGGLAFGILALSFTALYQKKRRWLYLSASLLFLVTAIFSHRVTAVYLFVVFVFFAFQILWKRRSKAVRSITSFCLILLPLLLLSFKRVELARFGGSFSLTPLLPVLSPVFRDQLPLAVTLEMTFYFIASYALLFHSLFRKRPVLTLYLLVPLFFFPFWNLNVLDMGYRMFLSAIPAGIVFVAMTPLNLSIKKTPVRMLISWLVLPFVFSTILAYNPEKDPPYEKYHEVVDGVELDDDSLLIAHLGLNHIYTFDKNFRDALNYIPDFPVHPEKLWRLAYGAPFETISALFPAESEKGEIKMLPHGYILIRERLWQEYLDWEDEALSDSLRSWFNPHVTRPEFIRPVKN